MANSNNRNLAVVSRAWASRIRQFIFVAAAGASLVALGFARLSDFGRPMPYMILGFLTLWVFAAFVADRTFRLANVKSKSEQFRWINPFIFVAIGAVCGVLAAIHEIMIGYSVTSDSGWRIVPTLLVIALACLAPFLAIERNKENFFCLIPSVLFVSSFMYIGSCNQSSVFNFMNSVNLQNFVSANVYLRTIYNNFTLIFLSGFLLIAFWVSFFRSGGKIDSAKSQNQIVDDSIGESSFQGFGHYSDSIFEFLGRVFSAIRDSIRLLLNSIFNKNSIIYICVTAFAIVTVYVAITATHMLFEQSVGDRSNIESNHANIAIGLFAMSAWIGILVIGWMFGTYNDWRRTMAGLIPAILMSLLALWVVSGLLELAGWLSGSSGLVGLLPRFSSVAELLVFGGIALFVALREGRFGETAKSLAFAPVVISLLGAIMIMLPFWQSGSQGPVSYTLAVRDRIQQAAASTSAAKPIETAEADATAAASDSPDKFAWLSRKWSLSTQCKELVTITIEGEEKLNWELAGEVTQETIKSVEAGVNVTTDHGIYKAGTDGKTNWTSEPGTDIEQKQELFPC